MKTFKFRDINKSAFESRWNLITDLFLFFCQSFHKGIRSTLFCAGWDNGATPIVWDSLPSWTMFRGAITPSPMATAQQPKNGVNSTSAMATPVFVKERQRGRDVWEKKHVCVCVCVCSPARLQWVVLTRLSMQQAATVKASLLAFSHLVCHLCLSIHPWLHPSSQPCTAPYIPQIIAHTPVNMRETLPDNTLKSFTKTHSH